MDDDSISRILAAMKKAPGATTIDMSRFEKEAFGYVRAKRALGGDIEGMVHICKEADDIRSRSRSSKHITTLNRLDEVLTDAQVFLDADPVTTRAITENCAPGRPDFRSALASGKSVVAEVRERFLNSTGFEG